jgi:hypothetical protein
LKVSTRTRSVPSLWNAITGTWWAFAKKARGRHGSGHGSTSTDQGELMTAVVAKKPTTPLTL